MMSNPFDPDRGKRFALRLILGALVGQTPKEFAEQELAIIEARQPVPPTRYIPAVFQQEEWI